MIDHNKIAEYTVAARDALNRVLTLAGVETLDVKVIGRHVEMDGLARRRVNAAVFGMPDGIARTVAVSAWCVFGEVLSQTGRGDMANVNILHVLASALMDHAHMIEGATAAQVVERAMRQSLSKAPSPRRHGKHRHS
ncbi:hypothetical protein [Nonomuraea sp. NPDC005650]|uniref:hypothetical protein n=1 Tax=Nonomuraea sp. NPDC005650 TaxID=3157045 RepID=UPI0033AFB796